MTNIQDKKSHRETLILITSVFIAGLCSIVYELLISTASSYFLGDSIKQFSITIGLYMAAMGIGSYISRLIKTNLLSKFIAIEILLGFLGGISIPALYAAYAYTNSYYFFMILMILSIGILIGLEIPLLTRIMERYYTLKVNISNVLSIDYLGALIATLLFPFILLPFMGTFRSSLIFGIINMGIGFMNLWCFADKLEIRKRRQYLFLSILVSSIMVTLLFTSQLLIKNWSSSLYTDRIIYTKQTEYQQIVLTRNKEDVRLYIDGNLQFSSIDEYRYHEPLVHVPMGLLRQDINVLIFGGGDGLAARELLKHNNVKSVTIVDLDPVITQISKQNPYLTAINQNSLDNPRVKVINQDAFVFLEESDQYFDLIISDLPDPNNVSLSRLYSREYYNLVSKRLSKSGLFVTQATSPFFSQKAFWCINNTIESSEFNFAVPYHVYVPSFGEWGFVMASAVRINPENVVVSIDTKFLDNNILPGLFLFEKDLVDKSPDSSTLDSPSVLQYYMAGWKYWN